MNFEYDKFLAKIDALKKVWEKELRPFLLSELADFNVVKEFVIEKTKNL